MSRINGTIRQAENLKSTGFAARQVMKYIMNRLVPKLFGIILSNPTIRSFMQEVQSFVKQLIPASVTSAVNEGRQLWEMSIGRICPNQIRTLPTTTNILQLTGDEANRLNESIIVLCSINTGDTSIIESSIAFYI